MSNARVLDYTRKGHILVLYILLIYSANYLIFIKVDKTKTVFLFCVWFT